MRRRRGRRDKRKTMKQLLLFIPDRRRHLQNFVHLLKGFESDYVCGRWEERDKVRSLPQLTLHSALEKVSKAVRKEHIQVLIY